MHRPTDRTVVHPNALSLGWTLDCVWQDGMCIGGVNADRVWTVLLIMLSRPISNVEVESNRRWIDEVKPARPSAGILRGLATFLSSVLGPTRIL